MSQRNNPRENDKRVREYTLKKLEQKTFRRLKSIVEECNLHYPTKREQRIIEAIEKNHRSRN